MSSSTTENSFSLPEPLEIQMYGSWSMSFPSWLVLQMGTYVLLLMLLVGCYQVLVPTTGVGEQIHQTLKKEPYALKILSWVPKGLLLIGAIELCETMVGLILFRKKWCEIQTRDEPQAS